MTPLYHLTHTHTHTEMSMAYENTGMEKGQRGSLYVRVRACATVSVCCLCVCVPYPDSWYHLLSPVLCSDGPLVTDTTHPRVAVTAYHYLGTLAYHHSTPTNTHTHTHTRTHTPYAHSCHQSFASRAIYLRLCVWVGVCTDVNGHLGVRAPAPAQYVCACVCVYEHSVCVCVPVSVCVYLMMVFIQQSLCSAQTRRQQCHLPRYRRSPRPVGTQRDAPARRRRAYRLRQPAPGRCFGADEQHDLCAYGWCCECAGGCGEEGGACDVRTAQLSACVSGTHTHTHRGTHTHTYIVSTFINSRHVSSEHARTHTHTRTHTQLGSAAIPCMCSSTFKAVCTYHMLLCCALRTSAVLYHGCSVPCERVQPLVVIRRGGLTCTADDT